jgi:tetratricopeptide (TPR) repeat protein
MISYPPKRVIAGVITALIALCHTQGTEARAQGVSRSGRQAKAASRPARSQPKEENEQARALLEEGLRRAEQKDWAQAFKAFGGALNISPQYGDVYIAMGDTYINMGKYAEGIKAYNQAISVAPSNPDAHYGLGAAYNDTEQYGDAIRHFAQAIRLDPDFAEAHYGLGYAYLKREKFKDALAYLRRAAQLQPDFWGTHLALGQTYLSLEDVKAAEKELAMLSRLDARAAGALEKEIKNTPVITNIPIRTERGGRSESAPPPREKSVAPNTVQEPSAVTTTRSAPQNQSSIPAHSPVQIPRPAALSADAGLAVELSFWESVKNSAEPEEFAAYLKKYPEGAFAELARIRLRALSSKKGEVSGEESKPEQQQQSPADNPAAPDKLSKPVAQTPAQDGIAQQPKEQLSEVQPAKDQPAKEQPAKEKEQPKEQLKELPKEQPKELLKELPAAEKPNSNEAGDEAEALTAEAALDSLRRLLPSKFSYKVSAAGGASAGEVVTSEVNINYEPLKFEGCTLEWRDQNDALRVALPDLDPEAVRVEPRSRPDAKFSIEVWNVSISATGGRDLISEAKGDGSGTVNRYNGLDLQYNHREKAERLARVLRQAIKLCGGKP